MLFQSSQDQKPVATPLGVDYYACFRVIFLGSRVTNLKPL